METDNWADQQTPQHTQTHTHALLLTFLLSFLFVGFSSCDAFPVTLTICAVCPPARACPASSVLPQAGFLEFWAVPPSQSFSFRPSSSLLFPHTALSSVFRGGALSLAMSQRPPPPPPPPSIPWTTTHSPSWILANRELTSPIQPTNLHSPAMDPTINITNCFGTLKPKRGCAGETSTRVCICAYVAAVCVCVEGGGCPIPPSNHNHPYERTFPSKCFYTKHPTSFERLLSFKPAFVSNNKWGVGRGALEEHEWVFSFFSSAFVFCILIPCAPP